MQEEITQKTMALAISTSRMTASVLAKAMRKFLEEQKNKRHQLPKGQQTLKDLMKHNTGVSNLEITNDNIRAFSATAKKYSYMGYCGILLTSEICIPTLSYMLLMVA